MSQPQPQQQQGPPPAQQQPRAQPHHVAAASYPHPLSSSSPAASAGTRSAMPATGGGGSGTTPLNNSNSSSNNTSGAGGRNHPHVPPQHQAPYPNYGGHPQQQQQQPYNPYAHQQQQHHGMGGGRGPYGGGRGGGGRGGLPHQAYHPQPQQQHLTHYPQQQPQPTPQSTQQRGGGGPTGAWQPAQPTSMQQQQPQPSQGPPSAHGGGGYHPGAVVGMHHPGATRQPPPPVYGQQPQPAPYGAAAYNHYPQYGAAPGVGAAGGWQQAYGGPGNMRGGVFYPPQQPQQQPHMPPQQPHHPHHHHAQQSQQHRSTTLGMTSNPTAGIATTKNTHQPQHPGVGGDGTPTGVGSTAAHNSQQSSLVATTGVYVPPERTKKPLLITDKNGNVLDLSTLKKGSGSTGKATNAGTDATSSANNKSNAATAPNVSVVTSTTTTTTTNNSTTTLTASQAGEKLRQAALERIQGKSKKEVEEDVNSKEQQQKQQDEKNAAAAQKQQQEEQEAAEAAQKKKEEETAAAAAEQKRIEEEQEAAAKALEEQQESEKKALQEAKEQATREVDKAEAEAAELLKAKAKEEEEEEKPKTAAHGEDETTEEKPILVSKPTEAKGRIVFTKEVLLKLRTEALCMERPSHLPDMTVAKGMSRGRSTGNAGAAGGGGGGGGRRGGGGDGPINNAGGGGDGGDWKRGGAPPRRQSSKTMSGGGGDWVRGQAMPPPKPGSSNNNNNNARNNNNRGGRGGAGGRGGGRLSPQFDGPVIPLVKTENHWRPKKNTSPLVAAEKLVKSILNKMTKEKFERLSQQMIDIEILSYDMLTMMIENVYDKAIDEPAFGDIYADLCNRISQSVGTKGATFFHIIESDEEPPTESGEPGSAGGPSGGGSNEASHNTVYRWSNDVSTTDSEIVGPFSSEEACREAALKANDSGEKDNDYVVPTPIERGEMELQLVSVSIRKNVFIKVTKKKNPDPEDGENIYYTVFFPVSEAEVCGQQLSNIHLSEVEAVADANKKNSFKRSLLNKCEEEFNKQDIYKEWKEEMSVYQQGKSSLSEAERAEKESELEFRRIRIKKQMLGNIKFIGQLFKKNMLKEKIMRYCISSLLKLEELPIKSKNPEYKDTGSTDMDEEDHEAICSMFATIGSTIDKPSAATFMDVCFGKIRNLSLDTSLPARSRFMYKDLIELRQNQWVPRRKEEKSKTIDEIRKEFEQEERKHAEESQRENARSNMNNQSYRGGGSPRNDFRQQGRGGGGGMRDVRGRPNKVAETDEEGFTTISSGKSGFSSGLSSRNMPGPSRGDTGTASRASMAPPPVTTKQSGFALLAHDNPKAYGVLEEDTKPITSTSLEKSKGGRTGKQLNEDQLKRRIISIRNDFMANKGDVDDLTLSVQELDATPNAGVALVQQSADSMMECKEPERLAIVKIITTVAEKQLVSIEEVRDGLMDIIEFIADVVVDSPRAYEYLGDLLASLLRIKVLTLDWICEQTEKTKDVDPKAPASLVRATLESFKKLAGLAATKDMFGSSSAALIKLLGSDDEWSSISQELLQ